MEHLARLMFAMSDFLRSSWLSASASRWQNMSTSREHHNIFLPVT
jgi:hypothetical protein